MAIYDKIIWSQWVRWHDGRSRDSNQWSLSHQQGALVYWAMEACKLVSPHFPILESAEMQVRKYASAEMQVRISTFLYLIEYQGSARTQSPTNRNCTPESPAFGVIAKVNLSVVQWKGLTLGEPPRGSRFPLCQVSMLDQPVNLPFLVSPSLEMMGCNFQTFTCRKINILT